MSSILEALKKLEEEKQRQLKLLEKEEKKNKNFQMSFSITTIAKPDTPIPVHDTASRFLTPKFLLVGFGFAYCYFKYYFGICFLFSGQNTSCQKCSNILLLQRCLLRCKDRGNRYHPSR